MEARQPVRAIPPSDGDGWVVDARHPRWTGRLRLDRATGRAVATANGSGGRFDLLGADLTISWDAGTVDRFRSDGSCYVHLDLLAVPLTAVLSDPAAEARPAPLRVAVITGYYKESRAFLERCMQSVRRQTLAATHILVADGFPQDWIDATGVRHLRLDRSHGDYGNTPRGVGALLAIAESYDVIGFLDADNWLEADHLEAGVRTARSQSLPCDFVIARMQLRRPDETVLDVQTQPIEQHVDTNCFLFFAGAFHAIMNFALMPQQLSPIGDRIFYAYLRTLNLASAVIPTKTVNYHCLWESIYRDAGEVPPPGAKPNIDPRPIEQWIRDMSPAQRVLLARRTGLVFQ